MQYVVMALGVNTFMMVIQGCNTLEYAEKSITSEVEYARNTTIGYLVVSNDGTTRAYDKGGTYQTSHQFKIWNV